ncbi:MAG: hypothetical protein M0R06_02615, partial [Sphaerochaeta sp.]|nr:hypothetical protein [Sphaerochaeta sp.]
MGIDRVRSWPYPATSIKDKATRDYLISLYNALSDESRSGITDAQAILDGVESDYIPLISSPATNHFPYQTAAGALIDSGYDAADFATDDHNHDSAYISIIASPETNHFPYQTAGGELTDSGYDAADFATAGHNHDSAYISIIASPETNHFPYQTAGGELTDSGYDAADFATAG